MLRAAAAASLDSWTIGARQKAGDLGYTVDAQPELVDLAARDHAGDRRRRAPAIHRAHRPVPESLRHRILLAKRAVVGVVKMKTMFPVQGRVRAATVRTLLSPAMIQILPGRDVPTDLGIESDLVGDADAAIVTQATRLLTLVFRALPLARARLLNRAVRRGLGHGDVPGHPRH